MDAERESVPVPVVLWERRVCPGVAVGVLLRVPVPQLGLRDVPVGVKEGVNEKVSVSVSDALCVGE